MTWIRRTSDGGWLAVVLMRAAASAIPNAREKERL